MCGIAGIVGKTNSGGRYVIVFNGETFNYRPE